MLLRSPSTPILKSWLPHSKEPCPESDHNLQLPRIKSVSLTTSYHPIHQTDDPKKKLCQTLYEADLQNPPKSKMKNHIPRKQQNPRARMSNEVEEELELKSKTKSFSKIQRLCSSSGLGESVMDDKERTERKKKENVLQTLELGGGGSNDGRISAGGFGGGRGSDGGGGGWSSFDGDNHGNDSIDAYYQKMIQANPANSLLLGNYAKFLKEVLKVYTRRFN